MGLTLTAACLQLCCCLLVSGTSPGDDYSPPAQLSQIQYVAFINVSYVDPDTGDWRTESEVGLYGSESRLEDEWGVVVHVRARDNRTDGCSPPVNAPSGPRWVALIRRGACKFHQKIHNAGIISNASAVVIYNNEDDTQLLTMKHQGLSLCRLLTHWCILRNAEFRIHVICGISDVECSAKYTVHIKILQSAKFN